MSQETEPDKILMIEDDYESMTGLKEHLENKGYQVVMTAAEDILQRLKVERFDLILLDQMIHARGYDPFSRAEINNIHFEDTNWKKTGLEFLRRLRAGAFSGPGGTTSSVPVIVVSAVANSNDESDLAVLKLANSYIEKPFRLYEIVHLIQAALQR